MASLMCDYLKHKVLDYLFGKQAFTIPDTLYLGFCTNVVAAGTVTGEPTIGSNGYARVAIDNNDISTIWGAAATGSKTNSAGILQFPQCTTSGWGALGKWFISDAATGGNTWCGGDLASPITVNVTDQPTFNTSQLTFSLTP